MSTYAELKQQAQALMEQAEAARKAEIASVISDIRTKMKEYGLTASDIEVEKGKRPMRRVFGASQPKYQGPDGQLWAGGLGRKPRWVSDLIKEGKDLEQYRISA